MKAATPQQMSAVEPAALAAGRRVLAAEQDAIRRLGLALDDRFVAAVDRLAAVAGRVVVCGMGKSGHVGRKIAATLASTGTPALFVHPAEASHGDLGMITPQDALICLSNSGETPELTDVVTYARRFAIPLIAIVGRAGSALAQAADVALVLPDAPEACPMGLAPTTSTTMTLALGDALAVALLERKGFSAENYRVFHPGGKLGRRLIKVGDLMHGGDEVPLVAADRAMSEALLEMTAKTFGCVGVVDAAGALIGIVTDGDLRRHMHPGLLDRRVDAVMTRGPRTIGAEALAAEALGRMNAANITSLFVTDGRRPVGIVRMHDCLRAGVA
ncbi:KpsF/GutQ family sugar-phosphate isomerase [Desertibaculum subflavum]|uniref:KpsF/GutQ family sugar-phosphate isomerase n=1 Tax=Desertibaculum subflavum TaxID=2268458 RepID=UPI000E6677CD